MTDHQPPASAPDQHLDDEVLAALIDGECAPAEAAPAEAHLAGCATCTRRREELAGTLALTSVLVTPLPEDVREAQIARALAAPSPAAEDGGPAGSPVTLPARAGERRRRRRRRGRLPMRVAAGVVLVAALGSAVYGFVRVTRDVGVSGSAGAPAEHPAAPFSPDTGTVGLVRPVLAPTPRSCPGQSAGLDVDLPDALDTPGHAHPACVALGAPVASIRGRPRARLSGPGGLAGPDTLTIDVPAGQVLPSLRGSPPLGHELVLAADGAAVGVVRSVTAKGQDVEIVVGDVPPAVAEYLMPYFATSASP